MVEAYHAQKKAQLHASDDTRGEQEKPHASAEKPCKSAIAEQGVDASGTDDEEFADLPIAMRRKVKALLQEQPDLKEVFDACVTDGPMSVDEFVDSFGGE